jgi:hypothetical protein
LTQRLKTLRLFRRRTLLHPLRVRRRNEEATTVAVRFSESSSPGVYLPVGATEEELSRLGEKGAKLSPDGIVGDGTFAYSAKRVREGVMQIEGSGSPGPHALVVFQDNFGYELTEPKMVALVNLTGTGQEAFTIEVPDERIPNLRTPGDPPHPRFKFTKVPRDVLVDVAEVPPLASSHISRLRNALAGGRIKSIYEASDKLWTYVQNSGLNRLADGEGVVTLDAADCKKLIEAMLATIAQASGETGSEQTRYVLWTTSPLIRAAKSGGLVLGDPDTLGQLQKIYDIGIRVGSPAYPKAKASPEFVERVTQAWDGWEQRRPRRSYER